MIRDIIGLSIAACIVVPALYLVLRLDVSRALAIAATATLASAVLIPSFATSAPVAVAAVLGPIAVLLVALFRDRTLLRTQTYPWTLAVFLTWSAIAGSLGWAPKLLLLNYATVFLLLLFAVAVIGAVSRGNNILMPLFAGVIVIEFIIGFLEEVFRTGALWPRANETDLITHRVNEVLPFLAGRAMGSTAQPIPYGVLVGFAVIVCVWFAVRYHSKIIYALSGVGLITMVFAGTRSAFLALGGVGVIWLLMKARWKRSTMVWVVGGVIVLGAAGAIAVGVSDPSMLATNSFQHRAGILTTAGNLLARDPLSVLLGTGYSSIQSIIDGGVVHGVKGIDVFDQEYVRTLAALGVVGLVLLIASIVRGIARGTELTRLLIVFIAFSFLFFDGLSWRLIAVLFVLAIAHGYAKPTDSAWKVPGYLIEKRRRGSLARGIEA